MPSKLKKSLKSVKNEYFDGNNFTLNILNINDDWLEFIIYDVFNASSFEGSHGCCILGAIIGGGFGSIIAIFHYFFYAYYYSNTDKYRYYSNIWSILFILLALYIWGRIGKQYNRDCGMPTERLAAWLNGFNCFFGGYRLCYFILSWITWRYSLICFVLIMLSWINFLGVL